MTTLRVEIPPKLIPVFAPKRGEVRYRVMFGGRGSGKSFTAAKIAAIWGAVEPLRILCTRELQNSIKESFHAELKNAIESDPWLKTQYDVGVDYLRHINNGTEFIFKGLRHNIGSVKSMAQIDLLIVEEAEDVPHASWTDLLPTIRIPKSEVWCIYNPKSRDSWVSQTFQVNEPPPRTIKAKVNWRDNPWLSDVLREQRDHAKETMSDSEYNHVWEGEYLSDEEGSVIKRSWILSAIDAHKKIKPSQGIWSGQKTVGYDVADDGGDTNATTVIDGSIIIHMDEWKGGEDELSESASRVLGTAKRLKANMIGYDSIGVGAGTGSILNGKQWRNHFKFNAAAKVQDPKRHYKETRILNEDFFANLKAQSWWLLADRFRNTHAAISKGENFPADQLISIDSESINPALLDKMIDELSIPRRDFDNQGKVKVESKKDLAKRDVKSPNIADSVVIAASRGMLARKSMLDVL
ncbi:hypothetical protein CASP1_00053 [Alcaligenes phage CASP1]|nr:hypothetical protein CASP1_00053 [Alcaligenes phage CASP1]